MKITPIEIRQHTFEKVLRGYKPEDVDAFLISLSQEWERVTSDYKMLKMQLELAEKELGKLKEVEMTLFRTLKTAEDTSIQITDQATQAAQQHMAEARQKADDTLADARKRSTLMVQDAENQARYLKDNILNDLKALEHDFRALEGYKENLGIQIRALAGNAIDSVDRFEKKFTKQNLKGKIDEVADQITEELKQYDAKDKPDYEGSLPDAPAPDTTNLVERETAIPAAIPADEPIIDKLDEAIAQPDSAAPVPERVAEPTLPAETPSLDALPLNAGAPQPEPVMLEATQPEPVAEAQPPKRSGSFFDQI